jgi:hypothetical protein
MRCDPVRRFASASPVRTGSSGRDVVKETVTRFFSIAGLTHRIKGVCEFDDSTTVEIEVECVRYDGKHVIVPNAGILVFDGELARDWKIYSDVAPVYAGADL